PGRPRNLGSDCTRLQCRCNDPFLLRPRPAPATLHRRDNLNRLRHRTSPSDSPRTSPNKSPAQGGRQRMRTVQVYLYIFYTQCVSSSLNREDEAKTKTARPPRSQNGSAEPHKIRRAISVLRHANLRMSSILYSNFSTLNQLVYSLAV